jgi:MoaA/NifB/PqqE/SkfB family radical SAM enzyme
MKTTDTKGQSSVAPFRLEGSIHEMLMNGDRPYHIPPPAPGQETTLPEPVFPQHAELLDLNDEHFVPVDGKRRWTASQIQRSLAAWAVPYFRSRIFPGEFHPIIAYLFNEWKCNLDCHYCWAFDNKVHGMTEDVARRSIDWLHDTGCRVLALMGGEPLLRPQLTHKIVYYAAKRGFFVYLATNGRLLRPEITDRLADAGISTVNLAVDAWDVKPGLPKAIVPIMGNFDYLVRKQYKYGYTVFLNINICRNNLTDVRLLTELANGNCIATDYHICESPMTEQIGFDHVKDNPTFIRTEDRAQVSELVDWLIERQKSGYKMVNSVQRLAEMKQFMGGSLGAWGCRAGQNSIVIRVDGTLAPCFPVYNTEYDWGTIEYPKFDTEQLRRMKLQCEGECFSTLNHILAFCYNDGRVIRWLLRQAAHGFQGIRGNMD